MKALIICENKDISKIFEDYFESKNIDTICYKWLLKALDNLEEIKPQLILINAVEFPRLWKTLCQYVKSDIFNAKTDIFLYSDSQLSSDDLKKAEELKIKNCITDLNNLDFIFAENGKKNDLIKDIKRSVLFTPENSFETFYAKVSAFENNIITCEKAYDFITLNMKLSYITFENGEEISEFKGFISKIDEKTFCIQGI